MGVSAIVSAGRPAWLTQEALRPPLGRYGHQPGPPLLSATSMQFTSDQHESATSMNHGKPPDGWECPACKKVQGVQGFNTSQTRKCRGQGGTCTTRLCSACGQGTAKPEKECQICKDVRGRATAPVRATVQDDVAASTGVAEAEQRVRAEAGAKEAAAVAEAEQR
eukprot:7379397-Prymnesium_polylepis.2